MIIKFKALRKSYGGYRQLKKSGDSQYDHDVNAGDVLLLRTKGHKHHVIIDCDKDTGEFSIKFDGDWELSSEAKKEEKTK